MNAYDFTLIASVADVEEPGLDDRFSEAGCDDATIALQKGLLILQFHREEKSFAKAVRSACRSVEAAGAEVIHLEPDPLVSISDIAGRVGVSRQIISLYANGDRGRDFPHPIARVTTDSPLWDWVDVATWFYRKGTLNRDVLLRARVLRAANASSRRLTVSSFRPHAGKRAETG